MNAVLIDKKPQTDAPTESLGAFLAPLIGQPFLLMRLGYADELSIHFGTARDSEHSKLRAKGIRYGSYMLLTRGSAWLVDGGNRMIVDQIEKTMFKQVQTVGRPITKEEIESINLITPGAAVVGMCPFPVLEAYGLGLRLDFSDKSMVIILPTADEPEVGLADWELQTPTGLLSVGPGKKVRWEPKS